jgi:hypothetical protein
LKEAEADRVEEQASDALSSDLPQLGEGDDHAGEVPRGGLGDDIGERDDDRLPTNLQVEVWGCKELIPGEDGCRGIEEVEGEGSPRRDGVGGERGSLKAPVEAGKHGLDDRRCELRSVRRAHPGNASIPKDLTNPKNEVPLVVGEVGGGLGEERGHFGQKGVDLLLGD